MVKKNSFVSVFGCVYNIISSYLLFISNKMPLKSLAPYSKQTTRRLQSHLRLLQAISCLLKLPQVYFLAPPFFGVSIKIYRACVHTFSQLNLPLKHQNTSKYCNTWFKYDFIHLNNTILFRENW